MQFFTSFFKLSFDLYWFETSVKDPDPDPHKIERDDEGSDPNPHQRDKQDPDPLPHQNDKLDPDPHQFADDKPNCMEN
jgi:hypothetical protein